MLVLRIKPNERVQIGSGFIKVLESSHGSVRLGFEFPQDISIEIDQESRANVIRFERLKTAGKEIKRVG